MIHGLSIFLVNAAAKYGSIIIWLKKSLRYRFFATHAIEQTPYQSRGFI